MAKAIKKVLIANRGEIALRVLRTCTRLGISTVTIFAKEEEDLPHALAGDQSFCLGDGSLSETYLNMDKIISLAHECKADAIHPGYGLLSENANFALAVKNAGLIFIGAGEEAISLMGDKQGSKIQMEKLGVPTIPGYHGEGQDDKVLMAEAKKIGVPLLIKASAGGGGKGMRVVEDLKDFASALESARREAKAAFGNDKMLLEKYLQNNRHIEVQVFSDTHGNHLHFFERDCSVQRRHQKIIEETPAPNLNEQTRKAMCQEAVKIARHINYLGAGTVEFIFDTNSGEFYFLEMNTRLQVEHPVTEMTTGADLVELQIKVAEGKSLPFKQEDIARCGHAMEVRLCAEEPYNDFLPATGTIAYFGAPTDSAARLDSGYIDGSSVGISFDPMLAKLIVSGKNRAETITKMIRVLDEVPILGLKTNREYLRTILDHREFVAGNITTDFVSRFKDDLSPQEVSHETLALVAAAYLSSPRGGITQAKGENIWHTLGGFRNA